MAATSSCMQPMASLVKADKHSDLVVHAVLDMAQDLKCPIWDCIHELLKRRDYIKCPVCKASCKRRDIARSELMRNLTVHYQEMHGCALAVMQQQAPQVQVAPQLGGVQVVAPATGMPGAAQPAEAVPAQTLQVGAATAGAAAASQQHAAGADLPVEQVQAIQGTESTQPFYTPDDISMTCPTQPNRGKCGSQPQQLQQGDLRHAVPAPPMGPAAAAVATAAAVLREPQLGAASALHVAEAAGAQQQHAISQPARTSGASGGSNGQQAVAVAVAAQHAVKGSGADVSRPHVHKRGSGTRTQSRLLANSASGAGGKAPLLLQAQQGTRTGHAAAQLPTGGWKRRRSAAKQVPGPHQQAFTGDAGALGDDCEHISSDETEGLELSATGKVRRREQGKGAVDTSGADATATCAPNQQAHGLRALCGPTAKQQRQQLLPHVNARTSSDGCVDDGVQHCPHKGQGTNSQKQHEQQQGLAGQATTCRQDPSAIDKQLQQQQADTARVSCERDGIGQSSDGGQEAVAEAADCRVDSATKAAGALAAADMTACTEQQGHAGRGDKGPRKRTRKGRLASLTDAAHVLAEGPAAAKGAERADAPAGQDGPGEGDGEGTSPDQDGSGEGDGEVAAEVQQAGGVGVKQEQHQLGGLLSPGCVGITVVGMTPTHGNTSAPAAMGRRVPARLLPWACPRCTLHNAANLRKCKVCKAARPVDAVLVTPEDTMLMPSAARSSSRKRASSTEPAGAVTTSQRPACPLPTPKRLAGSGSGGHSGGRRNSATTDIAAPGPAMHTTDSKLQQGLQVLEPLAPLTVHPALKSGLTPHAHSRDPYPGLDVDMAEVQTAGGSAGKKRGRPGKTNTSAAKTSVDDAADQSGNAGVGKATLPTSSDHVLKRGRITRNQQQEAGRTTGPAACSRHAAAEAHTGLHENHPGAKHPEAAGSKVDTTVAAAGQKRGRHVVSRGDKVAAEVLTKGSAAQAAVTTGGSGDADKSATAAADARTGQQGGKRRREATAVPVTAEQQAGKERREETAIPVMVEQQGGKAQREGTATAGKAHTPHAAAVVTELADMEAQPAVSTAVKRGGLAAAGSSRGAPGLAGAWTGASQWVLLGSGLSDAGKTALKQLSSLSGCQVTDTWSGAVTHVVCGTDAQKAARRTIKYLMGIAYGRWVLDVEWVHACLASGRAAPMQQYEVAQDQAGGCGGATAGRAWAACKSTPQLLAGVSILLAGPFASKAEITALAKAVGATVLQRPPPLTSQTHVKPEAREVIKQAQVAEGALGQRANRSRQASLALSIFGEEIAQHRGSSGSSDGGRSPPGQGPDGPDKPKVYALLDVECCNNKGVQPVKAAAAATAAGMAALNYKWLLDCVGSWTVKPVTDHCIT